MTRCCCGHTDLSPSITDQELCIFIWRWKWEIYFLEGGINLLLLKLHPHELLLLYPPPLLIFSGFGHLFESSSHVHLLLERGLLGPRWSCFPFLVLLEVKRGGAWIKTFVFSLTELFICLCSHLLESLRFPLFDFIIDGLPSCSLHLNLLLNFLLRQLLDLLKFSLQVLGLD